MTVYTTVSKRMLCALAFAALLATPSYAQFTPSIPMNADKDVSPEELERRKANEAAAKAASSKIVAPKGANDPWAGARSPDPAPAPAKKGAAK